MPTYATRPYPLIPTPSYTKLQDPTLGEPDLFDALGTDMALVHNILLRALNCISLQAPHISSSNSTLVSSFCRYILTFHSFLHIHHTDEETSFFPYIEALTGEKGVMDVNVRQHGEFEEVLGELKGYIDGVLAGREAWDGRRVVEMVEGFGGLLARHLGEEVQTLVGLRRFGRERMEGVGREVDRQAERSMIRMGLAGITWAWAHIDTEYEGGLHKSWPPAPWVVKVVASNVLWRVHRGLVQFGACDKNARMKPLLMGPANEASPS